MGAHRIQSSRAIRTILFAASCAAARCIAGGEPALLNLSTFAQAGTGDASLYGGFVVSGGPLSLLVRAIGPGLAPFRVSGPLSDPALTVFDVHGNAVASNDNWDAATAATFAQVGAFSLPSGSLDSALVVTLPAGQYTTQIRGAAPSGAALLELYTIGGAGTLINLSARVPVAAGGLATAGFVISPGAGTRKLLVRGVGPGLTGFGVTGPLPDTRLVLMDANQNALASATADGADGAIALAEMQTGAFAASPGDSAVIATVGPGAYTAQLEGATSSSAGIGMVEVYDLTGSATTPAFYGQGRMLFVARLAPAAGVTDSGASGYAVILFDPSTDTAQVSLEFSGLNSPETSAHLELGSAGAATAVLFNFGQGSSSGLGWTVTPTGTASVADIVSALGSGQVFAEVDTVGAPAGELTGTFASAQGSQSFIAPAPPPALPANLLSAPDATAAARLLTQATFGPTLAAIGALSSRGIPNWIEDQMALPPSLQLAATRADAAAFPTPQAGLPSDELYVAINPVNRQAAWWKLALTAPDQLRQRVAFALSELFVVSEQDTALRPQAEALAAYYDLLVRDAFGNFRQLLNDVTLSPVMGNYLTYLRNQPANASTGSSPDENYAREVQQLFTIGLVQLRADGTLALDPSGLPMATYDQTEVTQMAKVFTGWSYANTGGYLNDPADTRPQGAADGTGWLSPLAAFPAQHDESAKTIVNGTVLPAGQTPQQDLAGALDALFNHPNTGPFVGRQLIQRLVTSNPSPGYVFRVAQVFADDGTGTRGNLGAVVRAILTDDEARSPDAAANPSYGKIKEPILRMTAFLRALHAQAPNGRFLDSYFNDPRYGYTPGSMLAIPEYFLGEGALQAPTVFNFFSPNFIVPGPLAAAGLVAPEMQLADANYSLNLANEFPYYLYRDPGALVGPAGAPSPFVVLDFSDYLPLVGNPGSLADTLNLVCCAGNMSAATRQQILTALQNLGPNTTDTEKVATAFQLAVTSADGARQK